MSLVCQSFNQGWLLAVLLLRHKKKKQGYIVTTSDIDIVDKVYELCKVFNLTTWLLSGYKREMYEIHIKGKREDIDYLLFNRVDNREFIRGFISGSLECKGKVIYTKGWNQANHREYYLQVSSSKLLVLQGLRDYLKREFLIECNLVINNPQSINRLRVYKKESIQLLDKELILSGEFSRSLKLLLKEL